MTTKSKFTKHFENLVEWLADAGLDEGEAFVLMTCVLGAMIGQRPADGRKRLIAFANEKILASANAAAASRQ
jgi:hypothetical protein